MEIVVDMAIAAILRWLKTKKIPKGYNAALIKLRDALNNANLD